MVAVVEVSKLRVDAAGAVGVRLAHLGAELAVNGAYLVVVVAGNVAAHDLPLLGGGHAVVARGEERDALVVVAGRPLGHVRHGV